MIFLRFGISIAHLITLTPTPICTLFANKELAGTAGIGACFVRLAKKCKTLRCEHGSVGKAYAPVSDPSTFGSLGFVKIVDSMTNAPTKVFNLLVSNVQLRMKRATTYSISLER